MKEDKVQKLLEEILKEMKKTSIPPFHICPPCTHPLPYQPYQPWSPIIGTTWV